MNYASTNWLHGLIIRTECRSSMGHTSERKKNVQYMDRPQSIHSQESMQYSPTTKQIHTCQPYRIFRENPGKLTSIPVYRGIYKIYRIFKKSNIPPQAAIVHVWSTLNHGITTSTYQRFTRNQRRSGYMSTKSVLLEPLTMRFKLNNGGFGGVMWK